MSTGSVLSLSFLFFVGAALPARSQCLQWASGFESPGGMGSDAPVRNMIVWDDGTGPALYVSGDFTNIGGLPANAIARWDGATWSTLGAGLTGTSATGIVMFPWTIAGQPVLVVGGFFDHAGGQAANNIAVWDGSQWSRLGAGFDSAVWDLTLFDDGSGPKLHAGGAFYHSGATSLGHVARWNGTQWQPLGVGVSGGQLERVYALQTYDDGSGTALFAGGGFTSAGGMSSPGIAKWNGASWSSLGGGIPLSSFADAVYDLQVFDPGTGPVLYACGEFLTVDGHPTQNLAGWNGTWHAFPYPGGLTDQTLAMTVWDDGSGSALYFAGIFTQAGGIAANRIARWNGSVYSALGSGIGPSNAHVSRIQALPDITGGASDLWAGGYFTLAGGQTSVDFARWNGCSGPGVMLCFGDASSATPCPCANTGASEHGCENSATTGGALLSSSGSTSPDTVVLTSQGELPSALSIFLQGTVSISPASFGDGLRCTGGALKRLYSNNASGGVASAPQPGDPSITARSAALGDPIAPGTLRYYQTYYRDPNLTFCPAPAGDSWNVSNAVRIQW